MRARVTLAVLLLSASIGWGAEGVIPIEEFARPPEFSELQFAPDGKSFGFIRNVEGKDELFFVDAAKREPVRVNVGSGFGLLREREREVQWFEWIGGKRVIASVGNADYTEGVAAFDRDGKYWKPLSGSVGYSAVSIVGTQTASSEEIYGLRFLHSSHDDVNVLVTEIFGRVNEQRLFRSAARINTTTGIIQRVPKLPEHVTSFVADDAGAVKGAIRRADGRITLLHRANEAAAWQELCDLADDYAYVSGFSADGAGIYLDAQNAEGFRAFYRFDIAHRQLGEPLIALPGYDVSVGGRAIRSRKKRDVVGYLYSAEKPGLVCLDDGLARRMAAIDRALPDTFNQPISFSDDDRYTLVFASSDRDAGSVLLFDAEKLSLTPFVRRWPGLPPEKMAAMRPIQSAARDRVVLRGYITLPVGVEPRDLPLVVVVHDDLHERVEWGFDPFVQMLANRGYAVLQMNHRGSAGYGEKFLRMGDKQIAGAIPQDIEDAVRGAIRQRVVDPRRVAIMGDGLGACIALHALAKTPEFYRCGITFNAITDWETFFWTMREPWDRFQREEWIEAVGDPKSENEQVRPISPISVAASITAPVLMVHGKENLFVPPAQSEKMVAALEHAGRKPESLFLAERHSLRTEKGRLAYFKAVEAFLARNMGAEKSPVKP